MSQGKVCPKCGYFVEGNYRCQNCGGTLFFDYDEYKCSSCNKTYVSVWQESHIWTCPKCGCDCSNCEGRPYYTREGGVVKDPYGNVVSPSENTELKDKKEKEKQILENLVKEDDYVFSERLNQSQDQRAIFRSLKTYESNYIQLFKLHGLTRNMTLSDGDICILKQEKPFNNPEDFLNPLYRVIKGPELTLSSDTSLYWSDTLAVCYNNYKALKDRCDYLANNPDLIESDLGFFTKLFLKRY